MQAIRQKCRPKHQVLILKCYPRTTKGAVDVKPNSSELSYLLYYATTRRSKIQKVGAFLEKKTASDVWRARIGNVQVTLQILAALMEKAPRDLPLYAPYVLRILNITLRSRDITMVESSIATFEAFCEHSDGTSLSADQEYLHQYVDIVSIYASFASTRPPVTKNPVSAPVAMRWRNVGLQAIKSVASSDALASVAGRQLSVVLPVLLENIWTDNEDFMDSLERRVQLEEKVDTEKLLLRRRTSIATVRTFDTATEANPVAASGTTADADKVAEEDIGVLAVQCLKQIFEVNNRSQIHEAILAMLKFIAERVDQQEAVIDDRPIGQTSRGWATRVLEMVARWTPVQDRYIILVTTMDSLVRNPLTEDRLQQQLVLATMVDHLLKSDINLIGLSVMDVLLGLIQQILRVLQLNGSVSHENDGSARQSSLSSTARPLQEMSSVPTDVRKHLLARLQDCIGDLATHVYYADQISDMVAAILMRLKPSPSSNITNAVAAIEDPAAANAAVTSAGDVSEDPSTDGFFSFDTAKVTALEAIKSILLVAAHRKRVTAGSNLGRNQVPLRVWEGTQWLLRDGDGRVRKAYADALMTWLNHETTKSDVRLPEEKSRPQGKAVRDDSSTNFTKRAVSNASHREKPSRTSRNTFLQLLHLAIYENALQYAESEADIVLLYLLLACLVERLGVNAVRNGLPMVFRLQEDILEAETPLTKIRMGSLCHGYFWSLSEIFEFDSSPVGRTIQSEINRRQGKSFWTGKIRHPPIGIDHIGNPGEKTPLQPFPLETIETEALRPFDDRFQMVKLISLSYAESTMSPISSAPTSPGKNFTHPILSSAGPGVSMDRVMPEIIKDQLMSEWSRDSVIAVIQENNRTISLNGSRTNTNTTGHRNFLAVNGNLNGGAMNSGNQSPSAEHHSHTNQRNKADSTYGLVGGLGAFTKIRRAGGGSPSPASESSRNSVTRVEHLKRVLTGHESAVPGSRGVAHSDASSESMVSYDYAPSELSFNPGQQALTSAERSASGEEMKRTRSKSQERSGILGEHLRPLSSHPIASTLEQSNKQGPTKDEDTVPPVPPLPSSLTMGKIVSPDQATSTSIDGEVTRPSTKSKGGPAYSSAWGQGGSVSANLESLLNGIDSGMTEQKGNLVKPPY